jgi:hypothetical protein
MKLQTAINIFFLVLILIVGGLSLRHENTAPPEPINYELLKYRYEESQKRVDTLQLQVNQKDTTIYENSNFVRNAARSKRDSLRSVINPR